MLTRVLVQVRKMARIFDEGGLRIDEDSPNIVLMRRFVARDRVRKRSSNEGLRRTEFGAATARHTLTPSSRRRPGPILISDPKQNGFRLSPE